MEKTKIVHVIGCFVIERPQNPEKARQERLLHMTEDARSKTKADKIVTVDLIDCTKDWRRTCDGLENLAEHKRLQQEMVRINFQKRLENRPKRSLIS